MLSQLLTIEEYEEYSSLFRALRHSQNSNGQQSVKTGDILKLNTEFFGYGENLLIVSEESKWIIQMIRCDVVCEDATDLNSPLIKQFFSGSNHTVIDNFGRKLNIQTQQDLIDFITETDKLRHGFEQHKERYRRYMKALTRLHRLRNEFPNESAGETFESILHLADQFATEMQKVLIEERSQNVAVLQERFYQKIPETEKQCLIFGLYIGVLRAYLRDRANDEIEPNTILELNYLQVLKDCNYYLQRHPNILADYSHFMKLRPCETASIHAMLKRERLDGSSWLNENSEIMI